MPASVSCYGRFHLLRPGGVCSGRFSSKFGDTASRSQNCGHLHTSWRRMTPCAFRLKSAQAMQTHATVCNMCACYHMAHALLVGFAASCSTRTNQNYSEAAVKYLEVSARAAALACQLLSTFGHDQRLFNLFTGCVHGLCVMGEPSICQRLQAD